MERLTWISAPNFNMAACFVIYKWATHLGLGGKHGMAKLTILFARLLTSSA